MPVEPLQNNALALRDIHLPEPVSWWPPAPGWWLLLALLIIVCSVTYLWLISWRKNQQKKRIQKASLIELENIRSTYNNDLNLVRLARSLSILLRRICLSYYPHTHVPGMTGEQWLSYLDETAEKKGFKTDSGNILATAPYLPDRSRPAFDAENLLSLCEAWILAQPRQEQLK